MREQPDGCHHCGLSPRVRGNPKRRAPTQAEARSIPACAGEPQQRSAQWGRLPVYPRVCGGTMLPFNAGGRTSGLSPRVRGNLPLQAGEIRIMGSIPACAGEPRAVSRAKPAGRVYPRVCGGTRTFTNADLRRQGLSPRVRGNRSPPAARGSLPRSIPACAGEPTTMTPIGGGCRVYPRVCGGTLVAVTSIAP